jgi:hypothetical protein
LDTTAKVSSPLLSINLEIKIHRLSTQLLKKFSSSQVILEQASLLLTDASCTFNGKAPQKFFMVNSKIQVFQTFLVIKLFKFCPVIQKKVISVHKLTEVLVLVFNGHSYWFDGYKKVSLLLNSLSICLKTNLETLQYKPKKD